MLLPLSAAPVYYTLPPVIMESPALYSTPFEENPQLISQTISDFANDLCMRIAEGDPLNRSFAISPVSIIAALGMCLHIIEPDKKEQFLHAINLGHLTEEQAHDAISTTLRNIILPKDFTNGKIEIAQALAHKKNIPIADSLPLLLETIYDAELIISNDLMNQVNLWVSEKTHKKIPTLLSNNEATLVLLNAIYLNFQWEHEFRTPKNGWTTEPFLCFNGHSSPVSMMKQFGQFRVYRGNTFDMLEKCYLSPDGRKLSQLIFLPHNPQDLPDIEKDLTDLAIRRYQQKAQWENHVALSMPKIKMETELHLLDLLTQMGFPLDAIDRNVIFDPRIYIDDIIHKTFVSIDEKGTEAAAVTGVITCGCAPAIDPTTFNIHHSYAYCIMDGNTVLFRGKVTDATPLIVD